MSSNSGSVAKEAPAISVQAATAEPALQPHSPLLTASMTQRPAANKFVAVARHVYNPLGFQKGYNFVHYFIWAGAFMGFILARFQYISFYGIFCNATAPNAAVGECYWYSMPQYRAGIILHLSCILPAGFLAVFQFTPVIRHKFLLYHRIAGHVILLLVVLAMVGALMIAREAFGGELDTQAWVGATAIMSLTALFLAYVNIRRRQIEQHRAWMLRAWFYMGCIISLRLIFVIAAFVISLYPVGFYSVQPCAKLVETALGNASAVAQIYAAYPACLPTNANMTVDAQVVVKANMNTTPVEAMSAINMSFGMAAWIALVLHAVGVELYLRFTPREAERLRAISYRRQLECGFKNPGSSGIVVERFGDADPWMPPASAVEARK